MAEICKVLLLGAVKVGKTAFLLRYSDSQFHEAYISTVGIDYRAKEVTRDGKTYTLQLWDTAGQERYQAIVNAYFRGSNGFIIIMDLTDIDALEDAEGKMTRIKEANLDNPEVILVGNKSDLTESRVITKEQGIELAQSLGIEYFETSAKDGTNVAEAVDKLLDLIYGKPEPKPEKIPEVIPAMETGKPTEQLIEKPLQKETEKPIEQPIEKPLKKEPTPEKKPDPEKKPSVETIPEKPTKPVRKPAPAEAKSCCSTGTFLLIGIACVVAFTAWYFS